MPYVLPTKAIDPAMVGDSYHFALGMTSPGQPSPDRIFGYLMAEGTRFEQTNDIKVRDSITQNASPNLIDRDLVNVPRVTMGDFSGGAQQINWIDPTRFWDSDLDVRTPGFLILNPAWLRRQVVTGVTGGAQQLVAFKSAIYGCWNTTNVYDCFTLTAYPTVIVAKLLETDGDKLFVADGVNSLTASNSQDPTTFTLISGAIGPIKQMWAANLGTAGHYLFYTTDGHTLFKVDLSTNTIGIAVPLGGSQHTIVDIEPYQGGVAIVTTDTAVGSPAGFDVWMHDGATSNRMIRVNQYVPTGLTSCLGSLYVAARGTTPFEMPVLMRIGNGAFDVVASFGLPVTVAGASAVGDPVSTGRYVYLSQVSAQINGISSSYVTVFDVISGALWHFGSMDANDFVGGGLGIRQLIANGRSPVIAEQISGNGHVQFLSIANHLYSGSLTFAPTGWLFSSRIDFATPSIEKLVRRVIVHHAALRAGESIQVNAYIDTPDPTVLTTATSPTATITNPVVGSTTTVLTLPPRTIGFSCIIGLKLTPGTSQLTTPIVYYAATEISVSWTWTVTVDCSSRRRMLNGGEDSQGLRAKDLVMLIHAAWEQALPLTFYHPNGTAYTVVIEQARFVSDNPINRVDPEHSADLEGQWTLTIRDAIL